MVIVQDIKKSSVPLDSDGEMLLIYIPIFSTRNKRHMKDFGNVEKSGTPSSVEIERDSQNLILNYYFFPKNIVTALLDFK